MIVTEEFKIGRKTFIKTYSDENRFVVRDEISYYEAMDPKTLGRTYTEGDPIPEEEE